MRRRRSDNEPAVCSALRGAQPFGLSLCLAACGGASEPASSAPIAPAPLSQATTDEPSPASSPQGAPSGPSAPSASSAEPAPISAAIAEPAPPVEPPKPAHQGRCPAGMSEVPGGKFKSSYYRQEMSVEPFCVDVNLATTDEYTACIESGQCDKTAVHACDPSTYAVEGRGSMPMVCIDFMQAERYCKAQGKRIVSDLEWEWAARGGDEARTYPWGDEPPSDQLCWSGNGKRSTPCPVASYPPGPHGLYDLSGNILQWTTTTNDSVSSFRGGRGGSWKDGVAEQVKNTRRGGFKNTYRCGFLGVRCSMPVP